MNPDSKDSPRTPSFARVFGSVLASMFGVQSSSRHKEDFVHGKPSHYIVVGLVMTLLFIILVWLVVKLVMKLAGL